MPFDCGYIFIRCDSTTFDAQLRDLWSKLDFSPRLTRYERLAGWFVARFPEWVSVY